MITEIELVQLLQKISNEKSDVITELQKKIEPDAIKSTSIKYFLIEKGYKGNRQKISINITISKKN
jgi:hypothetical protein